MASNFYRYSYQIKKGPDGRPIPIKYSSTYALKDGISKLFITYGFEDGHIRLIFSNFPTPGTHIFNKSVIQCLNDSNFISLFCENNEINEDDVIGLAILIGDNNIYIPKSVKTEQQVLDICLANLSESQVSNLRKIRIKEAKVAARRNSLCEKILTVNSFWSIDFKDEQAKITWKKFLADDSFSAKEKECWIIWMKYIQFVLFKNPNANFNMLAHSIAKYIDEDGEFADYELWIGPWMKKLFKAIWRYGDDYLAK